MASFSEAGFSTDAFDEGAFDLVESISAEAASFTLTGVAAGLKVDVDSFSNAAFDTDAFDVDAFSLGGSVITLGADAASFTLTGTITDLERYSFSDLSFDQNAFDILAFSMVEGSAFISADPAVFTFTGFDTALKTIPKLPADAASYTLTGQAATLFPIATRRGTPFTVDYANLDADSPFAGDSNFSAISIGDICVYDKQTSPDAFDITMDGTGLFQMSGIPPANQTFDYYIYDLSDGTSGTTGTITIQGVEILVGEAASFVLNVPDVTFPTNFAVDAQPGSYTLTGTDANLLYTLQLFPAEAASYQFTGIDAVLLLQNELNAEATSFVLTGADATFPVTGRIEAQQTDYVLSVEDALLTFSGLVGLGGTFNASAYFAVGQSVTIELYFPTSGSLVPLSDNVCTPVGVTGMYVWDSSKLSSQPSGYQEYIWKMTDGTNFEGGVMTVNALDTTAIAQIAEIYRALDLDNTAPNTYADDGSSITNSVTTLTKSDNGNGTFTVVKTDT